MCEKKFHNSVLLFFTNIRLNNEFPNKDNSLKSEFVLKTIDCYLLINK